MRWLMINGYTGQNKVQSVDPARSCNWIIKRDSPAEVGRIVDENTRGGRSQEIAGVFRRWSQGLSFRVDKEIVELE